MPGPWHTEWQSYFPESEVTVQIPDSEKRTKSTRRADVNLGDHVLEFQHSRITECEVRERLTDYGLLNKEIIWVLDGCQCSAVKLPHSGRYWIETGIDWIKEAFTSYPMVFLNIGDQVFSVYPEHIKSRMYEANPPWSKGEFIQALRSGSIQTLKGGDPPPQTTLTIRQQGAGNGKTWGIIQRIIDPEFSGYETFVYVTKMHSAKYVIKSELEAQIGRDELPGVQVLDGPTAQGKQFILTCTVHGQRKRIIFGTIDSLLHSITSKPSKGSVDAFTAMVRAAVEESLMVNDTTGSARYAGGITLNKKLMLIGDEMQDLHEDYARALLRISRDFHVRLEVVGDTLQSIQVADNAFMYFRNLHDFPYTEVKQTDPSNLCRRFTSPQLVQFVNSVVRFAGFELPNVEALRTEDVQDESLHIFPGKPITRADADQHVLIEKEVDVLMGHYEREVEKGTRKSEFLVITPFVKNNPLVEGFHTRIREFWSNREGGSDRVHSFYHKSEEGSSIDLSESDAATRIVSIHASKGDGRKVVFVLGVSESALTCFQSQPGSLVYESLWHVALTRMKSKLYLRIEPNNDDIHRRVTAFQKEGGTFTVPPNLEWKDKHRLTDIESDITANLRQEIETLIDERGHRFEEPTDPPIPPTERMIVDMKHHQARRHSLMLASILNVDRAHHSPQCRTLLGCAKLGLTKVGTWREYNKNVSSKGVRESIVTLLHNSNSARHRDANKLIEDNLRPGIVSKLRKAQMNPTELVPSQYVYLQHCIDVFQNGAFAELSIEDAYDILLAVEGQIRDAHGEYERSFYEAMERIHDQWDKLHAMYPRCNWCRNNPQHVGIAGHKITYCPDFLGCITDSVVISVHVRPQVNSGNYTRFVYDTLFHDFFLREGEGSGWLRKHSGNAQRYVHVVLSPDLEEPLIIEWSDADVSIAREALHNGVIKRCERYINSMVGWYAYWRRKTESKGSKKSIKRILKEAPEAPRDAPGFFVSTLNQIMGEVEAGGELSKYDCDDVLRDKLLNELQNMCDCDSSTDSSDTDDE